MTLEDIAGRSVRGARALAACVVVLLLAFGPSLQSPAASVAWVSNLAALDHPVLQDTDPVALPAVLSAGGAGLVERMAAEGADPVLPAARPAAPVPFQATASLARRLVPDRARRLRDAGAAGATGPPARTA